ncbi:vomeronasal type-1 receptor 4-like [Octodon degus]|uniref:Vomeronasal type-1 receptor n=1 Tax=Octodon degus TaxID=10160 RepID=A0A6P6DWC1_OCTDE|nr:vomeronasal type-1 receptor 4-like [Octodon degus]
MSPHGLAIRIIFVAQTGVGMLGNILLLYCYIFIPHTQRRLKQTDLIIKNLILANWFVLLSRGIPHTMVVLGLQYSMGNTGCKLVFYLHRVARGVTLGTICILSGCQAITISASHHSWVKVKAKDPKYMAFSITFCWILHMLVNSGVPVYITGARRSSNSTLYKHYGYCSSITSEQMENLVYSMIMSSIDVLSLGFMVSASIFMMLVLYRHKQSVLHIHSKNFSSKFSAETRATQTIFILLITFFSLYILSSFFTFYLSYSDQPSPGLMNISALLAASFSCVSPFVIITRDSHFSRLFCMLCCPKMNNFCKLIMDVGGISVRSWLVASRATWDGCITHEKHSMSKLGKLHKQNPASSIQQMTSKKQHC